MPDRLLPRRSLVDGFKRDGDFDEFLAEGSGHANPVRRELRRDLAGRVR